MRINDHVFEYVFFYFEVAKIANISQISQHSAVLQ